MAFGTNSWLRFGANQEGVYGNQLGCLCIRNHGPANERVVKRNLVDLSAVLASAGSATGMATLCWPTRTVF